MWGDRRKGREGKTEKRNEILNVEYPQGDACVVCELLDKEKKRDYAPLTL